MIEKEFAMKFISKLIDLTTQNRIIWMTLPKYFDSNDNEPLRKTVIADNQYAYNPVEAKSAYLINEYKSYCTAINGGIVTLFCRHRGSNSRLTMSIQTDPNHYLQNLSCDDEIQEMLRELLLRLSANIDDGVKFINDILNM